MKLSVMTWNTLFAGRDGGEDRRARSQVAVIKTARPDVFIMQEAKGLETNGYAGLHALEAAIEMRGFLALAPHTGQNIAIFIRSPLVPVSFEIDAAHFHHVVAKLRIAAPGISRPLTLLGAHLCPNGAAVRQKEAAYLAVLADPDAYAVLTGDFNSASPHDAEPEDFALLPAHHRARYVAENLKTLDRSVLACLEAAGWIDVGYELGGSEIPTVPGAAFKGTEFATMRCDYVLASKAIARSARSYGVIRNPVTDAASDHYPILVTFEDIT